MLDGAPATSSVVCVADATDLVTAVRHCIASVGASVSRGERVLLKPNLTFPRHMRGVTTSPLFLAAVLEYISDCGATAAIGEGDGGYGAYSADVGFAGHGLPEIARRFGAQLINLSTAPSTTISVRVAADRQRTISLAGILTDVDAFITMPVPKIHSNTGYSGAVKNQWGCLADNMRLRLHPDFEPIVWEVNRVVAPRLVLGDAQYILDRSGPLVGEPILMNRVIAGTEILPFDVATAGRVMGMRPEAISHLRYGRALGLRWEPDEYRDESTGPTHRFRLKHTLRTRVVAAAFPRQWAIDLLWFSPAGDVAHRLLYALSGNPVAEEAARVSQGTD